MYGLKIFLACGDLALRKKIRAVLTQEGYLIVGDSEDSSAMLRGVRSILPDVIVMDVDLPGAGGLQGVKILAEDWIAPIVILTSTWQRDMVHKVKSLGTVSFVVKPISELNLLPAIESALLAFRKLLSLEKEVTKLKETLEVRRLVEKAKGILMESLKLTEAQAFRRIQQQSMNKSLSMRAVAEAIILAADLKKK